MLTHTPYDGSRQPFTIGIAPLDPALWIEPDEHRARELALKDDLFARQRDDVFRARAETADSQLEVYNALSDYLHAHHPGLSMPVLAPEREPPLMSAARLVQDDLCLMRRCADGWRLVAAALCFPSSWSLAQKFDQPLDAIHAPVPGLAGTTGERIARIFDNLRPGTPVWRLNWSLYDDDQLAHPKSKSGARRWADAGVVFEDSAFVRVERQTLTKMPVSGDILFTIRIYLDPVAAFARHPDGARLAAGLRSQLAALDEAQLAYKNLGRDRDSLLARLDALIGRLLQGHARPTSLL